MHLTEQHKLKFIYYLKFSSKYLDKDSKAKRQAPHVEQPYPSVAYKIPLDFGEVSVDQSLVFYVVFFYTLVFKKEDVV